MPSAKQRRITASKFQESRFTDGVIRFLHGSEEFSLSDEKPMKRGDRSRAQSEVPDRPSTLGDSAEHLLDLGDQAIYIAAAILFLAAAAAMGGYSVITFIRHIGDDFPFQLVTFINDLLLVLIILEILGTVRSYLLTGTTSLAPFLYIGIISATRRILAIGAASTLGGAIGETEFRDRMIDLGANGGVVLALALALYLFGRHRLPGSSDETTAKDDHGRDLGVTSEAV